MKTNFILLAAVFLLALVAIFLLGTVTPNQATEYQDPVIGQPEPAGLPVMFDFWGRTLVAFALAYMFLCIISAVWGYAKTKKSD
jgi:hypothetical protein